MKNIKLNALENQSLNNREMNKVRGGGDDCDEGCGSCRCSCYYANNGGSSIDANADANATGGHLTSKKGEIQKCITVECE
jgi:natural product precursor